MVWIRCNSQPRGQPLNWIWLVPCNRALIFHIVVWIGFYNWPHQHHPQLLLLLPSFLLGSAQLLLPGCSALKCLKMKTEGQKKAIGFLEHILNSPTSRDFFLHQRLESPSTRKAFPGWPKAPVPFCVRRVHLHWNASMIMADGLTGLLGWSWHSRPISFKAWTNCLTCRYFVKKHVWDRVITSLLHTSPHPMSGCFALLAAACENENDFGRAVGCGFCCDSGCVCGLENGEALPSPISWRNV